VERDRLKKCTGKSFTSASSKQLVGDICIQISGQAKLPHKFNNYNSVSKQIRKVLFLIIFSGGFGLYGVARVINDLINTTTSAPTRTATVTIVDSVADTPATLGGTLTLKFENGQVSITGSVSGFSANSNGAAHGFHIHETGSTANDCKAAGGHFNPDKKNHGRPSDSDRHAGDLGNIVVAPDATSSTVSKVDDLITLGDGGSRDVAGRAIVIHARPDSWGQPTGAAGARMGCGIITLN